MFNRKHMFRITGSRDLFLVGEVFFKCERCGLNCWMDRFYFYLALRGGGRGNYPVPSSD